MNPQFVFQTEDVSACLAIPKLPSSLGQVFSARKGGGGGKQAEMAIVAGGGNRADAREPRWQHCAKIIVTHC